MARINSQNKGGGGKSEYPVTLRLVPKKDFAVQVSPVFEIDGEKYRVVMDGNHSYHAAKKVGAEPTLIELTISDVDELFLLEEGKVEEFLEAMWMDSDWYDIETGKVIW